MNPIDSYVRISNNRHWLSNTPKKGQLNSPPSITNSRVIRKKPSSTCQNKFNAEVMDTFCFHWPDMHSYVLVRVLDKTIAILPVRSRVAFLYFHHAPLPTHPSPRELRRALQPTNNLGSKRIQDIFKSWKHTLALDEDHDVCKEESDDDDDDEIISSEVSTPVSIGAYHLRTPPSTPKAYSGVTLSDVLSYEPNLKEGWIHAPCTVKDDTNIYDNTIIISTKHTELRLTSRCFTEKMMFMNLVKLKHTSIHHSFDIDDDDSTQVEVDLDKDNDSDDDADINDSSTSNHIMNCLQQNALYQIASIKQLSVKLEISKRNISDYTQQLLDLEQSMEVLLENTNNNIQFNSLRNALDFVNYQLENSVNSFHLFRERVSQLQERVSVHIVFLKGARQKYEQIMSKVVNHAWYPYTSFAGLILIISFLLGYFLYSKVN